jgi:hypothetical protein
VPTYDSTGAVPEYGQTCVTLYPVPENAYRLDYSYKARHPALAVTTDVIDNVPNETLHDIASTAFELCLSSTVGNDPDLAPLRRKINEMRRTRFQNRDEPDAGRRKVVRSLDQQTINPRGGPVDREVFWKP